MQLSSFGQKFALESGISSLMDDLGTALGENPDLIFMGGGNPGRVPAAEELFSRRLSDILADGQRRHEMLGVYQAPQGDLSFRQELATFLHQRLGWPVGADNIAIANGSQSAFFILYNMFAGPMPDGTERRIHLPLSPEYVGYRDIGLGEDFFSATRPMIERLEDRRFKYHVAFDELSLDSGVAALCLSRPGNPTGNMVTDDEIERLDSIARQHDVPLIIDGAYGLPFPSLIYGDGRPFWNENTILMLSLSKLGLPGVRTGIVIATPAIAQAFARANTVVSLASGTLGPSLLRGTLADGSLERLCREALQPFYAERRAQTLAAIDRHRGDLPIWTHSAEGAFFLWLWCEGLPIDSMALYERLKARGVIVLPGNDFFIGTGENWAHRKECIRLSYAGDPGRIGEGVRLIMDELYRAYEA